MKYFLLSEHYEILQYIFDNISFLSISACVNAKEIFHEILEFQKYISVKYFMTVWTRISRQIGISEIYFIV